MTEAGNLAANLDLNRAIVMTPVWYSIAAGFGALLLALLLATTINPLYRNIALARLFAPFGDAAWPKRVQIELTSPMPERVPVGNHEPTGDQDGNRSVDDHRVEPRHRDDQLVAHPGSGHSGHRRHGPRGGPQLRQPGQHRSPHRVRQLVGRAAHGQQLLGEERVAPRAGMHPADEVARGVPAPHRRHQLGGLADREGLQVDPLHPRCGAQPPSSCPSGPPGGTSPRR